MQRIIQKTCTDLAFHILYTDYVDGWITETALVAAIAAYALLSAALSYSRTDDSVKGMGLSFQDLFLQIRHQCLYISVVPTNAFFIFKGINFAYQRTRMRM